MIAVLWRLTRGYRLRPWESPYLRWRIETYQGWHADQIGFARFWGFVWKERRNLARYLKWAAENDQSPGISRQFSESPASPPGAAGN